MIQVYIENQKNTIIKHFDELKYSEYGCEKYINICDDDDKIIGYLEPLKATEPTEIIIELLAKWRDENQFAFPTRFEVTRKGTESWLYNNVIRNDIN